MAQVGHSRFVVMTFVKLFAVQVSVRGLLRKVGLMKPAAQRDCNVIPWQESNHAF